MKTDYMGKNFSLRVYTFLIWGYAKVYNFYFGGTQRGSVLILGYAEGTIFSLGVPRGYNF